MRTFFLLILLTINVFTSISQSSVIKKSIKKTEKYIKKYGDNILVKQAAKKTAKRTVSWSEEYVKRTEVILKRTSTSAYKRKTIIELTHNDLIQKETLIKKLSDRNILSITSVQALEELPLKSELSKQLIDHLDDTNLLNTFLSDTKDDVFFKYINSHPYLNAYSKLQKTSIRKDPKHLEWIENMQRWSNKKSNADKLNSKYRIKDLQIEEVNGKRIYRDGDKIIAEERNKNTFYATAGEKNEKGVVEANNFLNQNFLPNSTYIVDDRFKYTIDEQGRVFKAEAELLVENRGRNADLQAIGRDTKLSNIDTKLYQGGHIFAQQMNGPTELINILSQLRKQNTGGTWKALEKEIINATKNGKNAILKIELEYNNPNNTELPSLYKIHKIIDEIDEYLEIPNY